MGFPRALRHPSLRAACGGASQAARLVRKNPQSQPHILFSSRRKENVPLTVQEKRAAGGAVPLWRTPPDPLLSAPQTDGFSPHRPLPRHPPTGPTCLVFWADRGPGASCPYGEGPRRALVTFPRWKVTRGSGGAAPQSYLQARFDVSPPQAALGPGWRSAPQISSNKYRHPQPAGGSHGGLALRYLNLRRRCPPFLLTEGGRAC